MSLGGEFTSKEKDLLPKITRNTVIDILKASRYRTHSVIKSQNSQQRSLSSANRLIIIKNFDKSDDYPI